MAEALQFLIAGVMVGSIYGLVGIGFTTVCNVTGIVNFAQGDFAMVRVICSQRLVALLVPLNLTWWSRHRTKVGKIGTYLFVHDAGG